MVRGKSLPSQRESTVSWLIMGTLAAIAIGVFIRQAHYDPTLFVPRVLEAQAPGDGMPESLPSSDFSRFVPERMGVLSPLEAFGPDTLSEKINGKAELYLSAGFLSLHCQRFGSLIDPLSWMEVFVYDMGMLHQAFAVYSSQKREEAMPLDLTPFSYKTKNALFWVHGRYYVEIIASVPSEPMMGSMLSFGKEFVSGTSVEEQSIDELRLFPTDHLEKASIAFLISNAFGSADLTNVFMARYHMEGEALTAFLSRKEDPAEAQRVVEAYQAFLLENGGTAVPSSADLMPGALVQILDTFELIFRHDRYVAGVHEAETQKAAEKLALMLKRHLAEAVQ
ncbi:MAG: hypothetical protein AMK69_27545 [Nitrospira bacterium SG8_3]|nr:MAG: hypothetical protein AMK69_27545 [Nitrospira bacterium SG8_3]